MVKMGNAGDNVCLAIKKLIKINKIIKRSWRRERILEIILLKPGHYYSVRDIRKLFREEYDHTLRQNLYEMEVAGIIECDYLRPKKYKSSPMLDELVRFGGLVLAEESEGPSRRANRWARAEALKEKRKGGNQNS